MEQNNKLPGRTSISFELSLSKKDFAFAEKENFKVGIDWDFTDRCLPPSSIEEDFVYNIIVLSDRMKKYILDHNQPFFEGYKVIPYNKTPFTVSEEIKQALKEAIMEQNNKYYTPSIEEFHPGFEFQQKNSDTGDDIYDWDDMFMTTDFPEDISLTRVKYLDREDIESLGWKYCKEVYKDHTVEYYTIEGKGTFDLHQLRDGIISIIDGTISIILDEKAVVFSGTIRNKSELRRVMKMVGI